MIKGAHARNEARVTAEDRARGRLAGFNGYTFMSYMGVAVAESYGVDPLNCVIRLPDSIYKSWPSGAEYVPHWAQYARDCAEIMHTFRLEGHRLFQVDNEPNLTWPRHKMGPWEWAWFIDRAMFDPSEGALALLAQQDIYDVELGFTPFSHPDLHPEWMRAAREKELYQRMPWVAAHCYWQAPTDMYSPAFGSNFVWLHEQTEKPIYITECGNSLCQATSYTHEPRLITLSQIRERQAKEYPEYVHWVSRYPYVKGLYFYILGHNGDWEGFDLTESICLALSKQTYGAGSGGGIAKTV